VQQTQIREDDPGLFGDTAGSWLADIVAATDVRNELLHAVALNQCDVCGAASRFVHPRSGNEVNRSDEAVRELTAQLWSLREEGKSVAVRIGELVNARIVAYAKRVANTTGEIQNPPQVSPQLLTRRCSRCDGNGTGSATHTLGTAVEVWPDRLKASWNNHGHSIVSEDV
jgi:hypothetical protein